MIQITKDGIITLKRNNMSAYGLIKATSGIQRSDTISDWNTVNKWRLSKGLKTIIPKGASVKRLENSVALGIKDVDHSDCPELIRGKSFYISIIHEL